MKNSILYFILFIFCNLFSQDSNTLFSIGKTHIDVYDFMQNYYKNKLDTDTLELKESLEEYLDLYIKFKLKVVEAEQLGLDTMPSFLRELEGYRKQLVKPYLTDNKVSDLLLKEAYERLKYEVSASHILIQVDDSDTLTAFNKAVDIKRQLDEGESFIALAQKFSNDPSVKENNGNLGYFSALYMVYPFETAAYNTDVGNISDIVRTRFGYHILKVNDKRLSRGEVKVAHILIRNNEGTDKLNSSSYNKINEIHDSLLAGVDFFELAKKFSDDKKSSVNGGELDWFGTNKMVKEFEDVSFSLDSINSFSSPFQTDFGWHIVKLINKKSLPSFSEIKPSLKKRIERDSRSQKTRNIVLERLKKDWGFVENLHAKQFFYNEINSDFLSGGNILEKLNGIGHIMFVFNNQYDLKQRYVFQEDFANYLNSFKSRLNSKNIDNYRLIVDELYDTFKEQKILEIESTNLEYKYDEFRLLYNEYHDGILMYQLQKDEVWDMAISDTLGLQQYYSDNKTNYVWPNRVRAKIYYCNDVNIQKRVQRKLRRGINSNNILNSINQSSTLNLSLKADVFSPGDNVIIDKFIFGSSFDAFSKDDLIITDDNNIIYIDSLLHSSYKSLEEVKGVVISDYQSFLEKKWLSRLEKKHKVIINNELFVLAQKGKFNIKPNLVKNDSNNIKLDSESSFNSMFIQTVKLLGASKNTFFGWNGKIYNTAIQ